MLMVLTLGASLFSCNFVDLEGNTPPTGEIPTPPEGEEPTPPEGEEPTPPEGEEPNPPTGDEPNPPTGDEPNPPTGDEPNPPTGDEPNPPEEEKKIFTVTFINGDSVLATVEVEDGSKVTAPVAPSKVGYSFGGWYYGEELWSFDTAITESITLDASWTPNTYNVLFDYEGADDVTVSVEYGKTVTLPASPSKEHYVFLGWYLGNTPFDADTAITTDITLVPAWELEKHTVSFNTDGGTGIADVTASYGSTIEAPAAPEKSGYIFMGWYLGDAKWSFSSQITENITLTAKWQLEYLTVTFDVGGGSSVDAQSVRYDTYATAPAAPTFKHHVFAGWYYGDKLWDFAEDKVTDHITLTARWTDKTFIVTIDPDNGEEKTTLTVKSGKRVDAPKTPVKAHHSFGGWYCEGNEWSFDTDTVNGDVTIKAKWIVDTHTVKLDAANGEEVNTLTYNYGELVATPATPVKAHHKFLGWYCGEELWSFDTDTVSGDTLLVAKWELDTHTVIFNANNGTPTSGVTVSYGDKLTAPTSPTKAHYSFGGWYYGEELWSFDTDKVEGDITLVAKWVLDTHTVTFDAANGSNTNEITVSYGDKLTAPTAPTKAHYSFGGWYYGDKLWIFDGNVVESDMTLTAKWIIDTHTVTFDTDGGSNVAPITVDYGSKAVAPTAPTKMHYVFLGWYAGDVEWSFDSAITENVTLTAKWAPVIYTVTIDNANGDATTSYDVPYGTVIDTPATPVKAHSVFAGWYAGNVEYSFGSIIDSNVALTAKWTPDSHEVTFNTDGGSSVATITVTCGTAIAKPANPTKTGHTFVNWYYNGSVWDFSTPVTDDITLTANWRINTYTVQFVSNNVVLSTHEINYGSTIDCPTDPVRNYFTFVGWYEGSNSSKLFNFANPITGDTTITAKWKRITLTVTIDNNNGDPIKKRTVNMGSTMSAPAATKAPTDYDSYVLEGWYRDGVLFDFDSPVLEDITIKAKWITQDEANKLALYEQLKGTMGNEAKATEVYESLIKLNSFYDGDALLDWIAGLYDPNEGGFYYSNSARNFYPYEPDLESTSQAFAWVVANFAFENSYSLANKMPQEIIDSIINFTISKQECDGYFYHPQWPQGKENLKTDRYGRDLDNGNAIIERFDKSESEHTYHPNLCIPGGRKCEDHCKNGGTCSYRSYASSVAYTLNRSVPTSLGSSVGFAVSRAQSSTVSAVADISHPVFDNDIAFREWLETYNPKEEVKSNSGKAHNLASLKKVIAAETAKEQYDFYGILLDYLDEIQIEVYNEQLAAGETPSGMWQKDVNFKAVWGLLKYAALYNDKTYGRAMLYPEEKVASAIKVIKADFDLKNGRPVHYNGSSSTVNLNDMMNQWTCISSLISNMDNSRKASLNWTTKVYKSNGTATPTDDTVEFDYNDIYVAFRANAKELIDATINKLEYYRVDDAVLSYTPGRLDGDEIIHDGTSLNIIYGVPISIGVGECDLNGINLISSMYRFIIRIMTGKNTYLPLCTEVDGDRFIKLLSETEAPNKEHFTNDFENGTGNIKYNPTTDPDNVTKGEISTDPVEGDNALYFESHEVEKDKGYVNDSIEFITMGLPGNCYVFEGYIFVSSESSNGYILQNKLNSNLYMFEIKHNKSAGTVDIIENYTTASRNNIKTLCSGLPVDTWFKLRIEYYPPQDNTDGVPAIKVFVNGERVATTNGYYGSVLGYSDSLASGTYPENNFTKTTFMALRAADVYVYFDNVFCSAINKTYYAYSEDTSNGTN